MPVGLAQISRKIQNHYISTFNLAELNAPLYYWNNPTAYDTPPTDASVLIIEFCGSPEGDIYVNENLESCLTTNQAIYNANDSITHTNF